jgi:hypothetical protein
MNDKILWVRICRPTTDSWLTLQYEYGAELSAGIMEELVEHDFPGWKFVCQSPTPMVSEDNEH